ncbi:hypothetical protein DL769_004679 [Monosporascus sp. CRB-8-3]|nr:hypothetical protein DL769_004679 [Monosporascus sp. CRB-8-3]
MSSPAGAPSAASATKDGKGKDRMEKVFHRMRTVFRKGESSRRKKATSEPKVPTAAATKSEPVPPATKKQPEYPGATVIPKSQIHEERAKKLGARFGLEIKPSEWHSTEGDVLRVENYDYAPTTIVLKRPSKTGGQDLVYKRHRMRVRRYCHAVRRLPKESGRKS